MNFITLTRDSKQVIQDYINGLKRIDIWLVLAWQDIRLRYRRSKIGPFWITLSMGITILGMALLYSYLFKINTRLYFPYLASGMIVWGFFSMLVTEGTQIFLESAHYLMQIKLPFTVFVLRTIVRSFIIFLHNLVIMIPIILFFHVSITWTIFLLIPGFLLIFLAAFSYLFILAILGARFRDVTQIVTSLIQVVFFITPIIWNPASLQGKHLYLIDYNPFFYLLDLLRSPLLGSAPSFRTFAVCISLVVLGFFVSYCLMLKTHKRIIYWV